MKITQSRALFASLALAMTTAIRGEESTPETIVPPTESSAGILDASFDTLAKTLDEARTKSGEAIGQRDAALTELATSREAQAETTRQLEEAMSQLAAAREAEAQWKNEAATLAGKLSAGEEAYAQLGEFRSQMKEALGELAAMKSDLAGVRAELQAPAERMALRDENEALKGRAAGLEEQLKVTSEALTSVQGEREQLGNQMRDVVAENEQLKQQLAEGEASRQALAAEHTALGERAAGLESESGRVMLLANEAAAKVDGMIAAQEATMQELAATRSELESANETIAAIRLEGDALRQSVEANAVQLEAMRQQAEAEKAARATAEEKQGQAVKQVDEMAGKVQFAEQATAAIRQELNVQQARVAELEARIQEQAAAGESEEESESID